MSQRMLGRRCAAGHLLDGPNGSWQYAGSGGVYLICRACNRERAKRWRAANAARLVRIGDGGGQLDPARYRRGG